MACNSKSRSAKAYMKLSAALAQIDISLLLFLARAEKAKKTKRAPSSGIGWKRPEHLKTLSAKATEELRETA